MIASTAWRRIAGAGVLRRRVPSFRRRRSSTSTSTSSSSTSTSSSSPLTVASVFPHGLFSFPAGGFRLFPLKEFPARHAVLFGSAFAFVKTGAADALTQRALEGRQPDEINWRRSSAFAIFGLAYLGIFQYFLYVKIFTRVLFRGTEKFLAKPLVQRLRDFPGLQSTFGQTMCDSLVIAPLIYYPSFYLVQEAVMNGTAPGWAAKALERHGTNMREDMPEYWRVWTPAMAFNFLVCPTWMRVPFVASVSFVWTIMLSLLRGDIHASTSNDNVEESVQLQLQLDDDVAAGAAGGMAASRKEEGGIMVPVVVQRRLLARCSRMELSHVGARCSFSPCSSLDFLPITCEHCGLQFCGVHIPAHKHKCSNAPEERQHMVPEPDPGAGQVATGAKAQKAQLMTLHVEHMGGRARLRVKCGITVKRAFRAFTRKGHPVYVGGFFSRKNDRVPLPENALLVDLGMPDGACVEAHLAGAGSLGSRTTTRARGASPQQTTNDSAGDARSEQTNGESARAAGSAREQDHGEGAEEEEEEEEVEEERVCRICRCGEDLTESGDVNHNNPLFSPCLCAGSMRFVHVECLNQWRQASANPQSYYRCDQCGHSYDIRRTRLHTFLVRDSTAIGLTVLACFMLAVFLGTGSIFLAEFMPGADTVDLPTRIAAACHFDRSQWAAPRQGSVAVAGAAAATASWVATARGYFSIGMDTIMVGTSITGVLGFCRWLHVQWHTAQLMGAEGQRHLGMLGIWLASLKSDFSRTAVVAGMIYANAQLFNDVRVYAKLAAQQLGETVLEVGSSSSRRRREGPGSSSSGGGDEAAAAGR